MKFPTCLFLALAIVSSSAFTIQPRHASKTLTTLSAASSDDHANGSFLQQMNKMFATGLVTASLWAAPAMIQNINNFPGSDGPHQQMFSSSYVANAKQMASASGSRVNKDPESLLRYGLPINSKEVRINK